MSERCDLAIVGGGLAGGLIALALAAKRPALDVRIIEAGETIGGNHLWSFFGADVAAEHRWLVDPLIVHRWPDYEVRFPAHARTLRQSYHSIESERLDAAVRAALPAARILTRRRVAALTPTTVTFEGGATLAAGGVIDARGPADLARLDLGWQKFVGHELELEAPHGVTRPIVMDATVPQHDGYRFVYVLPFGARRVFVEDTYYSDDPALDVPLLDARIAEYAAAQGWRVREIVRREQGVLPVAIDGDFAGYWRSGGDGIAKAGMRAGLFHPTTGYSLPDAVRTAALIAAADDLSGPALHALTHDHAAAAWRARGFYRMLDALLFRAGDPARRYKVLERFYTLRPGLIGRFYAGRSTMIDKLRTLAGKPPVPFFRALAIVRSRK